MFQDKNTPHPFPLPQGERNKKMDIEDLRRPKLGEILVNEGIITKEELKKLLIQQKELNPRRLLGALLVEQSDGGSCCTEEVIAKALASQYEWEYIDLAKTPLDYNFLKGFPLDLLRETKTLPHRLDNGETVLLVSDPTNIEGIDMMKLRLGDVNCVIVTEEALKQTFEKLAGLSSELKLMVEEVATQVLYQDIKEPHAELLNGEGEQPVIKFLNGIIVQAIRKRASDIHLEIDDRGVVIKYRIDGVLQPAMEELDSRFHSRLISRIKVISELNIAEKRIPQDGRFKLRFEGRTIDFRVSVLPTLFGEAAVIRILDKHAIKLDLPSLGFEEPELSKFLKLVKSPHGMILVTGPTGSGKTTTLYAVMQTTHVPEEKILTIEDPIEYLLPDVVQVPVNEKKGLTFARGLRSLLRHDPDKIMVGEIRDAETAQIAVQSALTGHLVFTTIHANNVIDVIGRLINMGVEPYEFIAALNGILAQRLVRVICSSCKKPIKNKEIASPDIHRGRNDKSELKNVIFYEGTGCDRCNGTGYYGRTGLFELMVLSDELKELILKKESFLKIREMAKNQGLKELREAGIKKVLKGITTLKELDKVIMVQSNG